MIANNLALTQAIGARRRAVGAAAFATLIVALGIVRRHHGLAIAVYSLACVIAWIGVVMRHREVRDARAMPSASDC